MLPFYSCLYGWLLWLNNDNVIYKFTFMEIILICTNIIIMSERQYVLDQLRSFIGGRRRRARGGSKDESLIDFVKTHDVDYMNPYDSKEPKVSIKNWNAVKIKLFNEIYNPTVFDPTSVAHLKLMETIPDSLVEREINRLKQQSDIALEEKFVEFKRKEKAYNEALKKKKRQDKVTAIKAVDSKALEKELIAPKDSILQLTEQEVTKPTSRNYTITGVQYPTQIEAKAKGLRKKKMGLGKNSHAAKVKAYMKIHDVSLPQASRAVARKGKGVVDDEEGGRRRRRRY